MPDQSRWMTVGQVDTTSIAGGGAVIPAADLRAADRMLQEERYSGIALSQSELQTLLNERRRNDQIQAAFDEGVCVLDPHSVILWANPILHEWCGSDPTGKRLLDALGNPKIATEIADPFALAATGHTTSFRLVCTTCSDHEYIEIRLRPTIEPDQRVKSIVAITRNVTPEVEQQKRLDALHQAGRDLASLEADQLAEMNLPTRIELLKQNLRRYIHDLLHYDTIEVRVLDRRTGELKPLLDDGMTSEAVNRILYAQAEGNGVTGYVAFTGTSYLCADTTNDPHYLRGAADARSSMTVPLKYNDEVVGTLNVESPRTNGFGADDLQFTELFSKEIAAALHTLDLLSAQQSCAASQSIDAVNREIALPVDDLLATAAVLYARLHGTDPDAGEKLRRIMAAARQVKVGVRKVGEEFAPASAEGSVTTVPGAPGRVEQAAPPLTGRRVLVIDPDERMRKQAHLLLGRLGAFCETVGTASEGLALFGDDDYHAVFLDIRPPDMSAYETYRRLRDAKPDVQVAMTTGFGYDAGHSIVKGRQDGMQFTLFKPFRPEQVVKAVLTPPLPRGIAATPVVAGMP